MAASGPSPRRISFTHSLLRGVFPNHESAQTTSLIYQRHGFSSPTRYAVLASVLLCGLQTEISTWRATAKMPYDRNAIVQGMERYYELLVKLAYIEEHEIIRPPPTGWTDDQLLMSMLASSGRSDAVIGLVRHLPYLRSTDEIEVYPPCRPVSYLREDGTADTMSPETSSTHFHERIMVCGDDIVSPGNLIALASDERIDAWILDVDEGLVYICDGLLRDSDAPEDEPWRQGRRINIQDLFDEVCGQVESLLLIPIRVPFPWFEGGKCPNGRRIKRLLKENGWPENLHKDAYRHCLLKYHEAENAAMRASLSRNDVD